MKRGTRHGIGICALLAALSCAAAPTLPAEFARALQAAPAGATARMSLLGSRVIEAEAPLDVGLDPALARVVESIIPGGTGQAWSYWGPRGIGYRIVKVYRQGRTIERRSVTIDRHGKVLERSHQIPPAEMNASVRQRLEQLGHGQLDYVEVVQGDPEQEWYRAVADRHRIECELDGSGVRISRMLSVSIAVR